MKQQILRTTLGLKALVPMIAIAGLSMGNKGCEEPTGDRLLKMNIEIGSLKGRAVKLPNGEVIDFPYVANALFYRQVISHDHFVILNQVPNPILMAATNGKLKTQSTHDASKPDAAPNGMVSADDIAVLDRYGLLRKTRATSQEITSGRKSAQEAMEGKFTASSIQSLPACLYEAPQAILGGEVISFEATWGAGLGVGYGQGGDLGSSVGGKVSFKSSKLEIGLRTDDPLTRQTVAIGDGVSHKSEVNFEIDFLKSLIGLDFFYNTPITNVIRSAMNDGLNQIAETYVKTANVADWNHAWEGRVLYDPEIANNDTHVGINSGSRAGVQIGDVFMISNMHYSWKGVPCASALNYSIPRTVLPIAEGEVINIGQNVAILRVKYLQTDDAIEPGAQVKLLRLNVPVAPKTTTTK
jgi:hypothetical protein